MRRAAFTLIEVVLALALLGTLTVASVWWTTTTLLLERRTMSQAEHIRDLEVFERILRIDLINDDLHVLPAARREERVRIQSNRLYLLTRDPSVNGLAEAVYTLEDGTITRRVRPLTGEVRHPHTVLVSGVESASFAVQTRDSGAWADLIIDIAVAGHGSRRIKITVPERLVP